MQSRQMRRAIAIICGIYAALVALAALRMGLDFAKHETDMLHLVDIVLRLSEGAALHRDIMTPLGLWGFMPFVLLKEAGLGLGAALKWGQILVAGLLLVPAIWVAVSRFRSPLWGSVFAGAVLLMAAGLVYGGADPKLSLSMHYNRWAWAIAFLPLALVALPRQIEKPWFDAAVIGAAMAALVLIKATYFVAFAPAVILGLVLRGQGRVLAMSVAIGLAVLALQTLGSGLAFWQAYVGDLLAVMGSDVRPQPGQGWAQVMLSPSYAAGTLLAIGGVLWLRAKIKREAAGLVLPVMLIGAIYVSYQNYGNDPFWLLLWGLVLLGLVEIYPAERKALFLLGALALALVSTPAINVGFSPVRHLLQPAAIFAPLVPGEPDLRGIEARFGGMAGTWPLGAEDGQCTLASGGVGYMRQMAERLETAGHGGAGVYAAGLFNTFWLYGDFRPLKGGAPWYYGGLPGIEDADILVLPECSFKPEFKALVMEEIAARGIELTPIYQDELMAAFQLPK